MANQLREEDDLLKSVDYSHLLEEILQQLNNNENNLFQFSDDNKRLKIDVDTIAKKIAFSPKIDLPANIDRSDRCVSINFSDESEQFFPQQIRNIRDKLKFLLLAKVDNNYSLDNTIQNLLTNLSNWKNYQNKGLKYSFSEIKNIQKQRLTTFNTNKVIPSNSSLKLHKLTIKVENIKQFEQELKDSLTQYLATNFLHIDADTYEELEINLREFINYHDYRKNKQKSEIENLIDLVKTEAVGRLKKEAKIIYLEYILQHIDIHKNQDGIYLQDLIRRLRLLEKYLDDKDKAESDYIVNYEGLEVNYRDLLARGETYDILPIIPIVEGYLGENTNESKGEKCFIFALKLKLNGGVKNQGEKGESSSSFDYYLNLLNPDSKQHKEELAKGDGGKLKILKIVFIFTFIFASRQDIHSKEYDINLELEYNPVESWEEKILPILKSGDDIQKKNIFRGIKQGIEKYQIKTKVAKLETLLKKFLQYTSLIPRQEYPLQIGIRKNILQINPDKINEDGNFFTTTIQTKDCLKYIAISESHVNENYLCYLPVSLIIEDIRYYNTDESQTLNFAYDLTGIKTLPIMFLPLGDKDVKKLYDESFKQDSLILINYNHHELSEVGEKENINNIQKKVNNQTQGNELIFKHPDSPKAFFYRFVFSLLVYLAMEVILESVSQRIFIPIMRLHIRDKDSAYNEETFIRSFSKTLAHLLREEHLVNSQGFYLGGNKAGETFRIKNSLSSLYSLVPKSFTVTDSSYQPQLEKLALVIVSSREADANYKGGKRIANLYGEIIKIEKENEKVTVINDKTFSANYDKDKMYENPTVLTLMSKEVPR